MPKKSPQVSVSKRIEKLIPKFMKYQRDNLELLKKSLEINNFHEIARLGHIIKGAAGSYGFMDLTEIGNRIELAAKESAQEKVSKYINEYQSYIDNVKISFTAGE